MMNISYYAFIQDHTFIFFIALMVLAFSVILKSKKVLFIQLALFIAFFGLEESLLNGFLFMALFGVQLLFAGFIGFRLKKAVDYNFDLVLEKTHLKRPNLITGGNPGNQSTFL